MEELQTVRKKPLLGFTKDYLSINIILEEEAIKELRDVWENRVEGCQQPLVQGMRDGLHIHIPWILKEVNK